MYIIKFQSLNPHQSLTQKTKAYSARQIKTYLKKVEELNVLGFEDLDLVISLVVQDTLQNIILPLRCSEISRYIMISSDSLNYAESVNTHFNRIGQTVCSPFLKFHKM